MSWVEIPIYLLQHFSWRQSDHTERNIELSTNSSFQNQHYSKEIFSKYLLKTIIAYWSKHWVVNHWLFSEPTPLKRDFFKISPEDHHSILIETLSCQPTALFRTNTTQKRFSHRVNHKRHLIITKFHFRNRSTFSIQAHDHLYPQYNHGRGNVRSTIIWKHGYFTGTLKSIGW